MKRQFVGLMLGLGVLAGCRGATSDQPPVHINLNMDFQEKYRAQKANPLFEDGRAMRDPIANTVAKGAYLATDQDKVLHTGKDAGGNYVNKMPVALTPELLQRGEKQFHIYCEPCHGKAGDGKGVVAAYGTRSGLTIPASYHQDRLRAETDGYLYHVVVNGANNMAGYGAQIPDVTDRWAIVAWMRVLQRSQYAEATDVPNSEMAKLKAGK